MESVLLEWLNLLGRWVHVMAAILWIGDSFLFMWMDRNLVAPSRPREGAVTGELWMVHSGGFYELVKRRVLAPGEMPRTLHWFKWQAYTTWLSGFFLLVVVYYLGGGVYLVDPGAAGLSTRAAIGVSLGSLALGWILYDALWSSPLGRRAGLAGAVSFALFVLAAFGYTRAFSGRAAFLHAGALLATLMAANVWRRIIPAQTQMIAATRAGELADARLGEAAKRRSTHNHYLTFPVLVLMISNHFPGAYGHSLGWLVLVLLVVFAAAAKYVMNAGRRSNPGIALAGAAALIAVIAMTARPAASGAASSYAGAAPVSFATANAILERRCVTCHAARPSNPSFPQPPGGVTLEDPRRIQALAPRILARAVTTRTMPLGNLTGMTEEERRTLGAWIAQGARIETGTEAAPR